MTKENRIVRESFFVEVLMSVIICLAILSCLMMIRGFFLPININAYQQLIPIILVVIHAYIRWKWPDLMPCFLIHILSSVLFFFAVIFIPGTGFGDSTSNMVYFGIDLFALTFFSFRHRLTPTLHPNDAQVTAFPACVFPICGMFYVMMNRSDLIGCLIINTILSAVLYLVMRQIAVFDEKYYHSIRSSSRPVSTLKRQNYKTAACLVGIFAIALLAIRFVPLGVLTNVIKYGILAVLRFILPIILAIIDFIAGLIKDIEPDERNDGDPAERLEFISDSGWLRIISYILAILILIGLVLLVINSIRILIMNAPRVSKEKESTNDGSITDTIELIKPDKKPFFKRRPDFGKGYEKKVRKQFYDKTLSAMNKGLPVSSASTPGQIDKVLTENGDKEFSSLRQEYEKVRYGN